MATGKKVKLNPKTEDDFHRVAILLYKSNKLKESLKHIATAIKMAPRRASFHNHLGVIFIGLKDEKQAEKAFKHATELNVEDWDAWFNLGLLRIQQKEFDEAASCMIKITRAQPKREEAWGSLSLCYTQKNEYELAGNVLAEARKLFPESNVIKKNIGNLQYLQGDYKNSLRTLEQCKDPDNQDSELLKLKARSFFKINRKDIAIRLCDRALAIDPNNNENVNHIISLYVNLNYYEKAKILLEQQLQKTPNDADVLARIGMLYAVKLNLYKEGQEYLQKALSIQPDNLEVKSTLANSYIICGKLKEAEILLNEVTAKDPEHASAYRQLAHIKKMGKEGGQSIQQLEDMLQDADLTDFKKSELHFALADAYDQIEENDRAFKYLKMANDYDREAHPYNYQKIIDHSLSSLDVFTEEFFEERKNYGHPSDRPIFIVGMPRSGTTLTEQILSSHPDVFGAGELKDIGDIRKKINTMKQNAKYPHNIHLLSEEELFRLSEEHLDVLKTHSETAKHVSDKMPFNFYSVGFIHFLFPNAKIIYCRRNAIDNCLSCYFLRFSDKIPFSTDLSMLGKVYNNHAKLMEHWIKVLPSPIHIVDYEKMVEDHENSCKKLIEFCDLEWDDRCLSFYDNDRPVKTASNWQVRQPIYNSSVSRWKPYREHLAPLFESLELSPEDVESLYNR